MQRTAASSSAALNGGQRRAVAMAAVNEETDAQQKPDDNERTIERADVAVLFGAPMKNHGWSSVPFLRRGFFW